MFRKGLLVSEATGTAQRHDVVLSYQTSNRRVVFLLGKTHGERREAELESRGEAITIK